MLDLSFLYKKYEPQGVAAGYNEGMQDYYKQQELANQQAYADEARFRTKRGEALLDTDLAKAKWETNPEVQRAGLEHTQTQTVLYSAQAQEALGKISDKQWTDIANQGLQVYSNLYKMGMQISDSGGGGEDAYNSMKNTLLQQANMARDPQTKQRAAMALQNFEDLATKMNLRAMSPQQLGAISKKGFDTVMSQDPEIIKEKMRNAAHVQGLGITAAATSAHSNLSSIGKDAYAIAAGNGRKTPNKDDWEEARGGYRPNTEESKGFYFVDANGNRYANKEDVPPNVSVRIEQYVKKSRVDGSGGGGGGNPFSNAPPKGAVREITKGNK